VCCGVACRRRRSGAGVGRRRAHRLPHSSVGATTRDARSRGADLQPAGAQGARANMTG
jgi:hypothetical protein